MLLAAARTISVAALLATQWACSSTRGPAEIGSVAVDLPGGSTGIGFDDLRFSPTLNRVLAPAGRTGNLDLVDPESGAVRAIGGFSASTAFGGGHEQGTTSADVGLGWVFAIDRSAGKLFAVDVEAQRITTSVALGASPD